MQMRLVDDLQAFRRESFLQLVADNVLDSHVDPLMRNHPVNARGSTLFARGSELIAMSRLEGFCIA
jgi:hypothetical protein